MLLTNFSHLLLIFCCSLFYLIIYEIKEEFDRFFSNDNLLFAFFEKNI